MRTFTSSTPAPSFGSLPAPPLFARSCATAGVLLVLLMLLSTSSLVQAGETTRVSVRSDGDQGNDSSTTPSISANGRFVAFASMASNLVPNDVNGFSDVFVHDRKKGLTTRVSVSSAGVEGNGHSFIPSISANGRFVAFQSGATNLVINDSNGSGDIFVHDRKTGTTTRVSVTSSGNQGNNSSSFPVISANSRFVAFSSNASNLVPGDNNGDEDVFVHDRKTGVTRRVSVDSAGVEANNLSYFPSISGNGRIVAFLSAASNLVAEDVNGDEDAFVHDVKTGLTTRVSVSSAGDAANGNSNLTPSLSRSGRFVAFGSSASNLVPGDTNATSDIFVHDRKSETTERVSVDSDGVQGNILSFHPKLSPNGRLVVFSSLASNLVPNDGNADLDIFVHDRKTGQTSRVSVDSDGAEGNDNSSSTASISANGRFVAFQSQASNLVDGDTNRIEDIFVHDRK